MTVYRQSSATTAFIAWALPITLNSNARIRTCGFDPIWEY